MQTATEGSSVANENKLQALSIKAKSPHQASTLDHPDFEITFTPGNADLEFLNLGYDYSRMREYKFGEWLLQNARRVWRNLKEIQIEPPYDYKLLPANDPIYIIERRLSQYQERGYLYPGTNLIWRNSVGDMMVVISNIKKSLVDDSPSSQDGSAGVKKPYSDELSDLIDIDPSMFGSITTHTLRSLIIDSYLFQERLVASLLKNLKSDQDTHDLYDEEQNVDVSIRFRRNFRDLKKILRDKDEEKFNDMINRLDLAFDKCTKTRNVLVHGSFEPERLPWRFVADNEGKSPRIPRMPIYSSNLNLIGKDSTVVRIDEDSLRKIYQDMESMRDLFIQLISELGCKTSMKIYLKEVSSKGPSVLGYQEELTLKKMRDKQNARVSLMHCMTCNKEYYSYDLCEHLQQLHDIILGGG